MYDQWKYSKPIPNEPNYDNLKNAHSIKLENIRDPIQKYAENQYLKSIEEAKQKLKLEEEMKKNRKAQSKNPTANRVDYNSKINANIALQPYYELQLKSKNDTYKNPDLDPYINSYPIQKTFGDSSNPQQSYDPSHKLQTFNISSKTQPNNTTNIPNVIPAKIFNQLGSKGIAESMNTRTKVTNDKLEKKDVMPTGKILVRNNEHIAIVQPENKNQINKKDTSNKTNLEYSSNIIFGKGFDLGIKANSIKTRNLNFIKMNFHEISVNNLNPIIQILLLDKFNFYSQNLESSSFLTFHGKSMVDNVKKKLIEFSKQEKEATKDSTFIIHETLRKIIFSFERQDVLEITGKLFNCLKDEIPFLNSFHSNISKLINLAITNQAFSYTDNNLITNLTTYPKISISISHLPDSLNIIQIKLTFEGFKLKIEDSDMLYVLINQEDNSTISGPILSLKQDDFKKEISITNPKNSTEGMKIFLSKQSNIKEEGKVVKNAGKETIVRFINKNLDIDDTPPESKKED